MLSELFSALIPKAQAEEQPAKEEKASTNTGEEAGEAKEEEPAEEEEPEDVRCGLFECFCWNIKLTPCLPCVMLFHYRSLLSSPTVSSWISILWKCRDL